ncbi:MAG TPA: hypothetical protein VNX28_19870 [Gemmataceae bacterium]|jgi:hypothetical protein|nr:hypothetical protein [Gemmataceae bacterium]
MPAPLKSILFVLLGTASPVALVASVASTGECQAQTPPDKKALEAEKKALELQKKQALDAQKKALEAQKKAIDLQNKVLAKMAREAQKKREADALVSAYALLQSANSDYAGQKERAVQQVRAALTLIDLNTLKQSEPRIKTLQLRYTLVLTQLPAKGKGGTFESQLLSDSQLASAGAILQELAITLNAEKALAPLGHVNNALMAINAALRSSAMNAIKGKEAEVLTYAYILLDSANHDYAGRRVKAMSHLKRACNILEADILSSASVEERIKAIRDANAQALANRIANATPAVHELQYISDTQLLMAHALIQRVGSFMAANNPKSSVLPHLGRADREIGTALTIR